MTLGCRRACCVVVLGCWAAFGCAGCRARPNRGFDPALQRHPMPCTTCEVQATDCPPSECPPPVRCRERVARWPFPLRRLIPRRTPPVMVEVGVQPHSQFHPVPVQPIFTPRTDIRPPRSASSAEPTAEPPNDGAKLSEEPAPAPLPELIKTPEPEPEADTDQTTTMPRRLHTVSRTKSWIFRPPVPEQPQSEDAAEARVRSLPIKR